MKRKGARRNLNARAIVAMCGDGINDAPVCPFFWEMVILLTVSQALAAADVGIAVGSGSKFIISFYGF